MEGYRTEATRLQKELHAVKLANVSHASGFGGPPKVGVAIIARRPDGCILMGRRKGSHGAGTHSVPGGHLEPGEDIVD
ncbi:NUDIX domain-containing protein, partial [Streptococcus pneumoniae]|uniref:NUDIX domain-containing protein n=1 Tax=Streptococcus pneumoniae TaxID=1313 RepID=UPI0039B6FFFD